MKTFSKQPAEKAFRDVVCPVCGSGSREKHWDLGSFVFYRCSGCGLLYQYPQPVQEELSVRYDDEYFSYEIKNEKIFFDLMLKTLEDIDFNGLTKDILPSGPSFLDVGCATGMLVAHMNSGGWNGKGVEVCSASAEYGRSKRNADIITGTFEEAVFPESSFDVIHSSHLIEHLTDPGGYVEKAFRLLKPGGFLITTTPNTASFQAFLKGKDWRSAIADHMYLFSLKTLKKLLRNGGFDIVRWKTWGGIPAGEAPVIVKKAADYVCKKTGTGDVMVVLAVKPES